MAVVNEEPGLFALPSTGRFDNSTQSAVMLSRDAGVWLRKLLVDYADTAVLTVAPMRYDHAVRTRWEEIELYLDHMVRVLFSIGVCQLVRTFP